MEGILEAAMRNYIFRSMLSTVLVVCILSSGLAGAESVFSMRSCGSMTLSASAPVNMLSASMENSGAVLLSSMDTLQTIDEISLLDEDRDGHNILKEIAIFAIVGAAVGYAVYLMISPGEEERPPEDGGSGKPAPFSSHSLLCW